MVRVAPNDSIVRAKVKDVTETGKRESEYLVEVEVLDSIDVENLANFTRNRIGEGIKVTFRDCDKSELGVGKTLRAHVQYLGDERGGRFHGRLTSNRE